MPKITISFKHNKEDLELYNEIMRHSDRSGYVKDILKGNTTKELKGDRAEEDNMISQIKEFNFS